MSLNLHPNTQFTDADWDHAEDLEYSIFLPGDGDGGCRELNADEEEFISVLNTARCLKNITGDWPTYGMVLEFLAKQDEQLAVGLEKEK